MPIRTILLSALLSVGLLATDYDYSKVKEASANNKSSIDISKLKKLSLDSEKKAEKIIDDAYDQNIKKATEAIFAAMDQVEMDPKMKKKLKAAVKKRLENNKQTYVFLFTSKSVPKNVFYNFAKGIKVLNSTLGLNEQVTGKIIYNGLDEKKNIKNFMDEFANDKEIDNLQAISVGINPLMFQDLDIKKVPALVIAECPEHFKSLQCDYRYIVRGVVPFEEFLNILNEEDTEYKDYYFKFIAPK